MLGIHWRLQLVEIIFYWVQDVFYKYLCQSTTRKAVKVLPSEEPPSSAGLDASAVSIASSGWCGTSSQRKPTTWDGGLEEWWCRTPNLMVKQLTYYSWKLNFRICLLMELYFGTLLIHSSIEIFAPLHLIPRPPWRTLHLVLRHRFLPILTQRDGSLLYF